MRTWLLGSFKGISTSPLAHCLLLALLLLLLLAYLPAAGLAFSGGAGRPGPPEGPAAQA